MTLTPLAALPPAADFPLVPLPRDLKACAKWRKAGIRVSMRGDAGETRAEAWACESSCPGLLVQLVGDKKDKRLGLLHAATGWLVGGPAARWPATPAGLERALAASDAAIGLLPAGAWVSEDPTAQAEGGRAAFAAAARTWVRQCGSPSVWYVGASPPLQGWPDVVRRTAEEAAAERGGGVEVLGYADGRDRDDAAPMVAYRMDWLDRQPIVTDHLDEAARAAEAERLSRFYAEGDRRDLARLVLAGEDVPPVVEDALERIGRWSDGAPTLRGWLWAARQVLAAGGPAVDAHSTARTAFTAWDEARRAEDPDDRSRRLALFVALLAAVRRTPDEGAAGAELFPGRDGAHVGVVDVSPLGSARWRLFRRSLRWLRGSPLLPVRGVWDTCGDIAGPFRYRGDAMQVARERAQWAADHPDEARAKAEREGRPT